MTQETKLMPCGSNHSCFDCNNWYFGDGCSHLERMTEEEFEQHEQSLYKLNQATNDTENSHATNA